MHNFLIALAIVGGIAALVALLAWLGWRSGRRY